MDKYADFLVMILPIVALQLLPIMIPMAAAAIRTVGKSFSITRRSAAPAGKARLAAEAAA